MTDLETLRAENDRLRALLEEYEIDPEPYMPPPPQYGPPTAAWARMEEITRGLMSEMADKIARNLTVTRVRLPNDYKMKP